MKTLDYSFTFRYRIESEDGGVGMYVKDEIQFKEQNDILKIDEYFEQYWLEIKYRDKNCVFNWLYRSVMLE